MGVLGRFGGLAVGAGVVLAAAGDLTLTQGIGAVTAAVPQATPAMRDPRWRGMQRVLVLAMYGPGGEVAGGEASDTLCAETVALARRAAPVPVECAESGDPRLIDGATLVAIVQASVTADPTGEGKLFAIAARRQFTGGLEPALQYFGAAPLVVRFAETSAGHADRARVIDAALDDVLPWRRASGAPHRLSGE